MVPRQYDLRHSSHHLFVLADVALAFSRIYLLIHLYVMLSKDVDMML